MKNLTNPRIQIIAEVGINHNGKLSIAKKLIDESKKCGSDFVKFQIYNPSEITTPYAKKARYQVKNEGVSGNQIKMLKKNNLTFKQFKILKKLKLNFFKVPSGEITNIPYLQHLGTYKKQVFLSTGMSNINEISDAINTLKRAGLKKKQIVLMQCTSNYPTEVKDLNLNVLSTFKKKFKLELGFSDHSTNLEVPLFAIFKGARIIEKHIKLDKKMKGPDHKASLNVSEFKKMIKYIKNMELSFGSYKKIPNVEEKKNCITRKKIYSS